ncbi:MAG: tetratricopeptide repeat protein [Phycisphaerales bacterium]|nr:tetratricopeptide repeat protein [Phycisphaerales bacterium]
MPDPFNTPEDLGSGGTGRGPARRSMLIAFLVVLAAMVVMIALRELSRPPAATQGAASSASVAERVDAVLNSALQLRQAGENAKAQAVLEAGVREFPAEQQIHLSFAELLLTQGRTQEAYDHHLTALAIGPRTPEVELTAGTLASMLGKPERAIEHYGAVLAAQPSNARAALLLAQVQIKVGQIDEAKKNLLIAGNLQPDTAIVWGTLADLALRENKTGMAKQHIARARQLEPRVTLWRLIEARALRRENRPEEALHLLIGLDEAEKREPGVLQLMSECYGLLERPGDAADLYVAAAKSDPMRGDWAYEAALWLSRAGRRDEALPFAERASMMGVQGAAALFESLKAPE